MRFLRDWFRPVMARFAAFLRRQETFVAYQAMVRKGLLKVGRNTYGMPRIRWFQGNDRKITIGSFCSISPDVEILTGGNHPTHWVSLFPFRIRWRLPGACQDGMPTSSGDVVIGSDVWIGTGAMILSGVTVGDGAVIGARAVVTRDIPPYAIAVGCPARVVRMRFEEQQIQKLLGIRWWEWPDEKIREAVPLLSAGDIDAFLSKYG